MSKNRKPVATGGGVVAKGFQINHWANTNKNRRAEQRKMTYPETALDSYVAAKQSGDYPIPTTAERKFTRDYRDKLMEYHFATGDRRALAAAEGLAFALIEGGALP